MEGRQGVDFEMTHDRYGLDMAGSAEAVKHYDRALQHLLRFQPDVVTASEAAIAADPSCVMAKALRAYVGVMSSEWPDTLAAGELVAGVAGTNDREKAHLCGLSSWVEGDMFAAGRVLDAILAGATRPDPRVAAKEHLAQFSHGALVGRARGLIRALSDLE